MTIIGLSGYAGAGKDTAAQLLVDDFGFERFAFGDYVRDALALIDPYLSDGMRLSTFVDIFDWDDAKRVPPHGDEIRRLMQVTGDAVRRTAGRDLFIDALMRDAEHYADVVVSDVRFPEEALAITNRGGAIWRITRTAGRATNSHLSETAMDNFPCDVYLLNNSDILDLSMSIGEILGVRQGQDS